MRYILILIIIAPIFLPPSVLEANSRPPLYISFVWHMHQPIYWPGENVVATADNGRYGFSVTDVHNNRSGPYTSWPSNAIATARAQGLMSCGAQVTLTGSLMENLDALSRAGRGFTGWQNPWQGSMGWRTAGGNPAMDLVNIGYFHPLSALIDPEHLVMHLTMHQKALARRFPGYALSKGLFPPETAFSERMIPALRQAGVEWVLVDNIHFDRTLPDYPYTPSSNLVPPNQADQQSMAQVSWVQLNGLWAPSKVSAPWGYQPHRARHTDPATGQVSEVVVVPAARYEGNEDGRGGFGALNYESVLSQLEPYNTDPAHPMLVVLHHDGDNYGGGADSYYHGNFTNFVNWLKANRGRFECITVQDYLALYPPAAEDIIHVEDGSWSGADNGDPEFHKWNGDPGGDGYSPDRHSWAVMTAAVNRLATATARDGKPTPEQVLDAATTLGSAWRHLLTGETSCYWYWDGSEGGTWDSHPVRAANLALDLIDPLLTGISTESVPPTIYPPQREPYNPGELEWGTQPESAAPTIWTYVYDFSGVKSVKLWYRYDDDGKVGAKNHSYDSASWCALDMAGADVESRTNPAPRHKARLYLATLTEAAGHLLDYFVEAEDNRGNVARSTIRQVWVGRGGGSQGGGGISHYPEAPGKHDVLTVVAYKPGDLHWGINGWNEPPASCWPSGTTAWGDGRAVDTPLSGPGFDGRYTATIGPFDGATLVNRVDYVMHYADNAWSSPDRQVTVNNSAGDTPTVSLAAPAAGSRVSGTVRLIAAAADSGGVPTVQFFVDGTPAGTYSARPYEHEWDTQAVSAGPHTIKVKATDSQQNSAEATAQVTVSNSGAPGDCVLVSAVDGGLPHADGGLPPSDGGLPQADGGLPPSDGGLPQADGGVPADGGLPLGDGGMAADGGLSPGDGGMAADGGVPTDGGVPADGGVVVSPKSGGCKCQAGEGGVGFYLFLGLLAFLLFRRPRGRAGGR